MSYLNDCMEMNDMEIKSILTKLKKGLMEARPSLEDLNFGSNVYRERNYKDFYLWKESDNFFDIPGEIELGTGTRAVKSSAAFIYNIFGNDEIEIDGIKYNPIKYEDKLEALLNRKPAHLDGRLIAKDNSKVIYLETKLLEWSGTPKNLALAYLDTENYPKKNSNSKKFVEFFDSICEKEEKQDKNGEWRRNHKAKVYDVIQMTIHILGIYNTVCKGEELKKDVPMPEEIELINLVWDYDCKRYKTEKEEAEEYISELNNAFAPLFEKLHKKFCVKYISFSEFLNNHNVKFKDPARKEYLTKRYLLENK